jgi:hypothetical protein
MKNPLKLVTLYNATRHEYTLYRHNLTEDEANEAVRELSAQLFGLVILRSALEAPGGRSGRMPGLPPSS